MNSVMIKLGAFTFSVSSAAYKSLDRKWAFNWAAQSRLQNTPALHYTGEGSQTIDLQGTIYPGKFGKLTFVEDIAKEAAKGQALLMVSGTGKILNYWCVKSISQKNTVFMPGGIPRKITFSLKLEYYGESK